MDFLLYYAIWGGLFVIAAIATPITFGWYWNNKRMLQLQIRGVPVKNFGQNFAEWRKFTFKEDPQILFEGRVNGIFRTIFKRTNFYKILFLISFILFLLIPLIIYPFFLIPILAFFMSSILRHRRIAAARHGVLMRMYEVARAEFNYPNGGELVPWSYIQIRNWEDLTTPGDTIVVYPAKFRADLLERRESFESHFNTTVTNDNTWIYTWEPTQSAVLCEPISHLPTMAPYTGSSKYPWHVFPLGVGRDGVVSYSVRDVPHVLIGGTTGTGKSVIQRNIIFHCIQHNDRWRFLGVDVKEVELSPFAKYKKTVLGIATNLADGVEICRYAEEVMRARYNAMKAQGVNHFMDMKDSEGKVPYAILLMVDEAYMFMATNDLKSEKAKAEDELHNEASMILGNIARLGRAAGIHLVLATQRPDAKVIAGELKANLDVRIAAGRIDSTPSLMILDSNAATRLPGDIKGRGIIRVGGKLEQFQGFFAEKEWIDEWLQAHPHREPSLFESYGIPEDGEKRIQSDDGWGEELDEQFAIDIDDPNALFEEVEPAEIIDGLYDDMVSVPATPTSTQPEPQQGFEEVSDDDVFEKEDNVANLQEEDYQESSQAEQVTLNTTVVEVQKDSTVHLTPREPVKPPITPRKPLGLKPEPESDKVSEPLREAPVADEEAIEVSTSNKLPLPPKFPSASGSNTGLPSLPKKPTTNLPPLPPKAS